MIGDQLRFETQTESTVRVVFTGFHVVLLAYVSRRRILTDGGVRSWSSRRLPTTLASKFNLESPLNSQPPFASRSVASWSTPSALNALAGSPLLTRRRRVSLSMSSTNFDRLHFS